MATIPAMSQTNIGNFGRVNIKTLLNIMPDSLKWENCIVYKDSLYYVDVHGDSARFKRFCNEPWSEWVGGASSINKYFHEYGDSVFNSWVTTYGDTLINNYFEEFGDSVFNEFLYVYGDSIFNEFFVSYGDTIFNNYFETYGDSIFNAFFTNYGDTIINNYLTNYGDSIFNAFFVTYGDTIFNNYFETYGDSIFNAFFTIYGDTIINNYFEDNGDSVLNQYFYTYGDSIFNDFFYTYGDSIFNNYFENYGDTVINNYLTNYGDSIFNAFFYTYGDSIFNEYFTTYGDTIINNYFEEFGDSVINQYFTTYGDSVFNSYFTAFGDSIFNAFFYTYGDSIFNEYFTTYGDTIINNYFENNGDSVLNQYFTTYGDSIFNAFFTTYGDSIFNNYFVTYGDSIFNNYFTTYGDSIFNDYFVTYGDSIFNQYFTTYGDSIFNAFFVTNGDSIFNNYFTIYGDSIINNYFTTHGDSIFNNYFTTYGDSILNQYFTTYGDSIFQEYMTVYIDSTLNEYFVNYGDSIFNVYGDTTRYDLVATTGVNGAWVKILATDGTADSVLLFAGTNMTSIVQTDDSTIVFNAGAGGTVYTVLATQDSIPAGGDVLGYYRRGAWLKLLGANGSKDSVLFKKGQNIVIDQENDSTITISATYNAGNDLFSQLIYGSVTWSGDTTYTYDVSQCSYYIMGLHYLSGATTVTLTDSDPSLNRIDVIYVDTWGHVGTKTGTLSVYPMEPMLDNPDSQLKLTTIYVGAATVFPNNMSIELDPIYRENIEWEGSEITSIGSTISFNNTTTPWAGDSCTSISVSSGTVGTILKYTRSEDRDFRYNEQLVFRIKTSARWGWGNNVGLIWANNGSPISNSVSITSGSYGFDDTSSDWQKVVIPLTDFAVNGHTGDILMVMLSGSNWPTVTIKLDNIEIQSGIEITNETTADNYEYWTLGGGTNSETTYSPKHSIYGLLYNYYTILDGRGIIPAGWHLPSRDEFRTLLLTLDPDGSEPVPSGAGNDAGNHLKEAGVTYWGSGLNIGADNSSGFSAKGSGKRTQLGYFTGFNDVCEFWQSSLMVGMDAAYTSVLMQDYADLYTWVSSTSWGQLYIAGISIRLIKDDHTWSAGDSLTDNEGNKYPTIEIGEQVWMASNLITKHYNNGDAIANVQPSDDWTEADYGAWCYFNNDSTLAYSGGEPIADVNYNIYKHDTVSFITGDGITVTKERINESKVEVTISGANTSGATYSMTAETGTGGAWMKILGSDGSKDSVLLAEGTNMTISKTDTETITFDAAGGGATYSITTVHSEAGAWMKVYGSDGSKDSVFIESGNGITVHQEHPDTIMISAGVVSLAGMVDDINFEFADIVYGLAQTYTLDIKASYGYTITSASLETDSGTLTGIAVKIGSTSVTSLSNVTADSAVDETTATGANTVVAGDRVYIVTSTGYSGAPTVLRGKLKITRT
jgi:uncharacterized protein (TIGR02145 family)